MSKKDDQSIEKTGERDATENQRENVKRSPGQPLPQPPSAPIAKKRQKTSVGLAWAIVVSAIILAVGGVTSVYFITNRNANLASVVDGNSVATPGEASISDVVDKVSPSVVSIVTNTTSRTIFGGTQQVQAAGTGVIISEDGYILTNKHVVSGARNITVVTSDGDSYDSVDLVGSDPLNDIAYLKIDGVKGLTAATLGDSSTTRVGQSVIAIGNALGQYQNTVSSGIISGKGRAVSASDDSGETSESLTDMIQTDTAINSGNSGGPLINYAGQVIGLNTAIATDAEGIGFAIPINAAKGTIKQVLAGNGVQRAYLGVRYVDVTPEIAKSYNLSVKYGAYVTADSGASVESGSPAAQAGIEGKDVITKVNGVELGSNGNLSTLLGQYSPGEQVELTIVRAGSERTVKVTLGSYRS